MGQDNDSTKRRKWEQLKERERYQIEGMLKTNANISQIARLLGRDRRTIQREIRRGRTQQRDYEYREYQTYLADVGQRAHDQHAGNKGRPVKIGHNHELARYLEEKIVHKGYSPDAAMGELRKTGRSTIATVCTKTVYNYIDMGLFAGISNANLPVKRNGKKQRQRQIRRVALNNAKGKSIEERDRKIELRIEEGHWEMDCVVGKQGSKACLLVMTERKTATELIFKLEKKTQVCVTNVLDSLEREHGARFAAIFKTITVDNGCEFLDGERMERSIRSASKRRTQIYYAHPYSSWERGSNENQNKLIRRFVPKGTDIGKLTKEDVLRLQYWMNHYPRRRFDFSTPSQLCTLFDAC